ncbi:MAG: DNA-binding beta-propeller fold protein YncE [Myxococcota bacterium]|jgi:DNA-binding beta-propeller fold protein YncE
MFRLGSLIAVSALVACGGDKGAYDVGDTAAYSTVPTDASSGGTGGGGGTATGTGGWTTTAPETEADELALRPAQTDRHVFIANPDRDSLTRVDVLTHELRTIDVGRDPRSVLTTPDHRTAVVVNRGEDTVSLVDTESLVERPVPVRDNLNRLAISPDGRWAVLWFDPQAVRSDDPTGEAAVSFNQASFVEIATGRHVALAVGSDTRQVVFQPDGSRVVFVTDAALVVIDLTIADPALELISLSAEVVPPEAEDFALAPDGSYGFLRQRFGTELLVIDIDGRAVDRLPVGDDPTDLDISPDGTLAVVVCRGDRQLWVFDVADPFAEPDRIDLFADLALGALQFDPTGRRALIYSTVDSAPARYGTWDLATDAIELHALVKPAAIVSLSPDGETALVFHQLAEAPGADPASPFRGEHAVSVVHLADQRTNPILLPAEVTGYVHESTGRRGYFVMDGPQFLEVLDYRTLLYTEVPIPSPPVYVGVLPDLDPSDGDAPSAWVSQEHDLGRLSFWDPDDEGLETLTGFELNGGVE